MSLALKKEIKFKSTGSTYYWFKRFKLNFTDLMNPMGWDCQNVSNSFSEEITETEFIARLGGSDIAETIQEFLITYKKVWKTE